MYSYKVSIKDHWRLLSYPLIFILSFLLFMIYLLIVRFNGYQFIIFSSITIVIIAYGPAFLLHYNYYTKSKNSELVLHHNYLEVFKNKKSEHKIAKADILSIHIYMCPTYIDYGISGGMPMFEYNYLEIKTLDSNIIINNMIYPDLKKLSQTYFDIHPIFHKTFFSYIK
ncbi:hypothetical protein HDF26_003180 [Pedobacter cryoconitis]|nr:hypothetical protein [Pedobacter cryoconitis]